MYAGCCYDGLLYWFGTVVESFPEVCTELVCGAMISNTSPPFITATILSLQWPPFSSDEAVCKEPQNDYCIDVEGIIRCDGCVWYYESPCQRCCIDKLGHQHDLGEIWADSGNPCFNLTCTTAGIIESDHLPCPPLTHPPHTACILEEEDCCNIWKCPNCVDEDEAERDVGEVWQHPTNTCLVLECTTAGIMEKWITCPSPPPQPSPQCVLVMGEECCLTWLCPECVDDKDNTHSLDETWADPTNPCTVMVCKRDGPRRIPKQLCPPLPPQSPSYQHCRLTVVDCCPTWNCS
ncbi:hypothetical protein Pcinc_038100 [Petrolisthes cinctipes]|uniref:VWFC domain-containing protein n=1 Tax=Petrolisthes cinctipes TaxID=88211 RepID=A0AAE1EKD2_PETCI|nr:hypothetical protein Pcinc_038100 [Petrolisthes cinctipes]